LNPRGSKLKLFDPESLSHLGLVRYRDVTPGQTDRITIASTHLALRGIAG